MENLKALLRTRKALYVLIALVVVGLGISAWAAYSAYQRSQSAKNVNKPPAISLVGVRDRQTVKGAVPIRLKASDKNGVAHVKYFLDNKKVRVDTKAPYCLAGDSPNAAKLKDAAKCKAWDSKKIPNGKHQLLVVAVDKKGSTSRILVTINVNN